jgi:hypothetical protein
MCARSTALSRVQPRASFDQRDEVKRESPRAGTAADARQRVTFARHAAAESVRRARRLGSESRRGAIDAMVTVSCDTLPQQLAQDVSQAVSVA